MAFTPKEAVLFDLYTSLVERLAAAARSSVELVAAPFDSRRELA